MILLDEIWREHIFPFLSLYDLFTIRNVCGITRIKFETVWKRYVRGRAIKDIEFYDNPVLLKLYCRYQTPTTKQVVSLINARCIKCICYSTEFVSIWNKIVIDIPESVKVITSICSKNPELTKYIRKLCTKQPLLGTAFRMICDKNGYQSPFAE